jgi:hypothetical protein
VNTKHIAVVGHFRPYNSLKSENASGAVANPQIYKVNPRMVTTLKTLNPSETGSTAEKQTGESHHATRVSNPRTKVVRNL